MNPLYYLLVRNEVTFEFFVYRHRDNSEKLVKVTGRGFKEDLWVPLTKSIYELKRWMWGGVTDSYEYSVEDARVMWDSLVAIGFERKKEDTGAMR